jgi:hypothetical protein
MVCMRIPQKLSIVIYFELACIQQKTLKHGAELTSAPGRVIKSPVI